MMVHLVGAEDVAGAGRAMALAAADMRRAAEVICIALDSHRTATDEQLVRLEAAVDRLVRALVPASGAGERTEPAGAPVYAGAGIVMPYICYVCGKHGAYGRKPCHCCGTASTTRASAP